MINPKKNVLIIFISLVLMWGVSCATPAGESTKASAPIKRSNLTMESAVFDNATPSFSIKYPAAWKPSDKLVPGTFFEAKTGPYGVPMFTVETFDPVKFGSLEETVASFCSHLETKHGGKNFNILSSAEITLTGGIQAYEAELEWKHPMSPLYTWVVLVNLGDSALIADVTDMKKVKDAYVQFLYTLKKY